MRKMLFALAGAAALIMTARPAHAARFSPYLTSISVGAGAADFMHSALRDESTTAGAYDARLTVGTRTPLAFEAAYTGTTGQEADLPGHQAYLQTHSVTGNARLNLTPWRVQPFLTGGVGYINLHSYNQDIAPIAATNFAQNTNAVAIPMGAGVSGYIGRHALVELRGTYNLITGAKDFTNTHMRPDQIGGELRVGYAF